MNNDEQRAYMRRQLARIPAAGQQVVAEDGIPVWAPHEDERVDTEADTVVTAMQDVPEQALAYVRRADGSRESVTLERRGVWWVPRPPIVLHADDRLFICVERLAQDSPLDDPKVAAVPK